MITLATYTAPSPVCRVVDMQIETNYFLDREIEICHELAQYILGYEDFLTSTSDTCGQLDRFENPPNLSALC